MLRRHPHGPLGSVKPLRANLLCVQIAYTKENEIIFYMEDGSATIGASRHRPGRWRC